MDMDCTRVACVVGGVSTRNVKVDLGPRERAPSYQ